MPIAYEQVLPWGRSFDEYRRMFDLSDGDLARRVIDAAPPAHTLPWATVSHWYVQDSSRVSHFASLARGPRKLGLSMSKVTPAPRTQ